MNEIRKFEYEGNEISFDFAKNKETLINATQMAKAFGKLPTEFLRINSTISYIEALSAKGAALSIDSQAVRTVQ